MKKQIKQCKGFENEPLCKNCKRQNDEAEKTLVKRLGVPINSQSKVCQHYIYKKK